MSAQSDPELYIVPDVPEQPPLPLPIFEEWHEPEAENPTDADLAQSICRKMMTDGIGLADRPRTQHGKAYVETGWFPMTQAEYNYLERLKSYEQTRIPSD